MPKGLADSKEYALRLSAEEIRRYRSKAEHAARTEGAAWAECGVNPGARVLDLGCGPGAILPEVAARVSPGGLVVGIDQDPDAVATAAALAQEARLVNVSVRQGSAIRTGLDPDSFDVIMIRNVLVHAGQQAGKIVGHAASLLRPGGCLYLADIDGTAVRWDAIDSGLVDLYRRFEDFLVATRGADLSIGPKLGSYLRAAGLDIFMRQAFYQTVNPVPDGGAPWAAREAMVHAGFASADDVDRWEKAISRTAANPDSVVFVPTFSAAGRRRARRHSGANRAMTEIGAGGCHVAR
jgi:2-polyprenyl-3-methyl-5-hydroxy-6-metoxy-1,4-benzoquinol methylase